MNRYDGNNNERTANTAIYNVMMIIVIVILSPHQVVGRIRHKHTSVIYL